MTQKNILFISLNGHQQRYFRAVGQALATEYSVHHVHYSITNVADLLVEKKLPQELAISPSEVERIIAFLLIKAQYRQFGAIRRFLHSRTVLVRQAHAAIRFFYQYYQKHHIDLVCVWNGTLVALGAATLVAKKLGRKTLFFENGCLPNTTTVDPVGVNNRNSLIGKTREFYDCVIPDAEKLRQVYMKPPAIRELKAHWYQRLLKNKPVGKPEQIALPERYLFVPLQVHDDTQVLLHSPRLKTMRHLLDCVIPAVEAYNKASGDTLWVVVKEHPSDFGRVDYGDMQEKYKDQRVHFLRYYPTPELIRQAQGVITINSSVGLEAFLAYKPVITMGSAFYNVEGLVLPAVAPENLQQSLPFIDKTVDTQLIDRFLYYLRYQYLAEGSWRNPGSEHFASVKQKVAAVFGSDGE